MIDGLNHTTNFKSEENYNNKASVLNFWAQLWNLNKLVRVNHMYSSSPFYSIWNHTLGYFLNWLPFLSLILMLFWSASTFFIPSTWINSLFLTSALITLLEHDQTKCCMSIAPYTLEEKMYVGWSYRPILATITQSSKQPTPFRSDLLVTHNPKIINNKQKIVYFHMHTHIVNECLQKILFLLYHQWTLAQAARIWYICNLPIKKTF